MLDKQIQPETKIKLNGLDHIAINVKNMERSIEFYSGLLGFRVDTDLSSGKRLKHIELDAGNVFLALFEMPDLDMDQAQQIMTEDGYLHFAFATSKEHFPEIVQTLKENNVRLNGEPRKRGSTDVVYFYDPDGHIIEIHTEN